MHRFDVDDPDARRLSEAADDLLEEATQAGGEVLDSLYNFMTCGAIAGADVLHEVTEQLADALRPEAERYHRTLEEQSR